MMFDEIFLEKEHKELLMRIVEAARRVPREARSAFLLTHTGNPDMLIHPRLPDTRLAVYPGDLKALAEAGLLRVSHSRGGSPFYDVNPLGFEYYRWLKTQSGEPVREAEAAMRLHLDSEGFRGRHPETYDKWVQAQSLLWGSESQSQLTTVGHLCREAMQLFASDLVAAAGPPGVDTDPSHVVARMRSVLKLQHGNLGKALSSYLDALIRYWGALSDLVQRQEHGAQKEGEPLTWDDARRVVFGTLCTAFEIDEVLR